MRQRIVAQTIGDANTSLKCELTELQSVSNGHSQEYDNPSNGGTEVGVRVARGILRTLRSRLEG